MGNGDGNTAPQPVKSYPPPLLRIPPPPSPPRILNFVTAGAAATAGFLGFSEVAGVLALLSLIFGFWDFFQNRDTQRHQPHTYDTGSPPVDPGSPVVVHTDTHSAGAPDRPKPPSSAL